MLSLIISSSVLSSALISLIFLISSHLPAHAVTVTVPAHSHLSHLSSSHVPAHAVAVAIPAHSHLSHLSSSHLSHLSSSHLSHLSSSHLPTHAVVVVVPTHSHLSRLSSFHLSHLSSSHLLAHVVVVAVPAVAVTIPRCPRPRLNPRRPSRSTSGQCSLFFCSEFFNLGVCCFGLIFLGLVLFCVKKWCCPYVVLGKIKKTFVLE